MSRKGIIKEASKTYNIKELWQRNRDLGLNSKVDAPSELVESLESAPGKEISPSAPSSKVSRGGAWTSLLLRHEIQ